MSITLTRPGGVVVATQAPALETPADTTSALLAVLRDVVSTSADLDPDVLHSTRPAGRAVLTIAAAGRAHVAQLGSEAGTPLPSGPGIVVMQEVVQVLRLLERTAGPFTGPTAGPVELSASLSGAYQNFRNGVGRRS